MKISEIIDNESSLIRDGKFDNFGLTAEVYSDMRITYIADKSYIPELLKNSSIRCVITTKEISDLLRDKNDYGIIVTQNPKKFFFSTYNKYYQKNIKCFKSKISKQAKIDINVNIPLYNVIIEDGVVIERGVFIYGGVHIKKGSIIRSGSVLGGCGFQFYLEKGKRIRVESSGRVVIGENVEVQNNCTIDRGVFGDTLIGDNVKIDNLCHIAHDVKIGENSLITAGTVFAGRVCADRDIYTGPNSVIRNGISIEKGGRVSIGSVVVKNVKENETVTGNFAIEHSKFLKQTLKLLKLIKKG